jgi:hypothetical protein
MQFMHDEITRLSPDERLALVAQLWDAQTRGLVPGGDPAVLADRYHALLWGDLLIRLLMRLREAPTEREIEARARAATETLMALPLLAARRRKQEP